MVTYFESAISAFPYTNFIHRTNDEYHNHTFWEFGIILHGESINQVGNARQKLSSGSVILSRPIKDIHRIKITSNNSVQYRHRDLYVSDEKMKGLCAVLSPTLYEELYNSEEPIYFTVSTPFLNFLEKMASFITTSQDSQKLLQENIHASLIINLLTLHQLSSFNSNLIPEWLSDLKAKLSSPSSFIHSVDEIIKTVPFSHPHICREFKKYIGVPVISYFNEQKMRYASYLLMNTTLKIIDVSSAVGYSAPKNFIQQFKKQFSVSPSEWRLKNQLIQKK